MDGDGDGILIWGDVPMFPLSKEPYIDLIDAKKRTGKAKAYI
jgi:hypothetical protein